MRRMAFAVAVLTVAVMASGCVTVSGGVAPSTRPIQAASYEAMHETDGTSWGIHFLGFLPLKAPNTKDAVKEAERGFDAVVGVTTDTTTYHLLLLRLERIKVTGQGARLRPTVVAP